MISQLTVFLENEKGRLLGACEVISDADINLKALFVADTEDFGIARIFCDTPHAAAKALQEAGYRASITPVIGVRVPHRQGGLVELLRTLNEKNIDIEYSYCFSINQDYAVDILKADGPDVEESLKNAGFELVEPEDIYVAD